MSGETLDLGENGCGVSQPSADRLEGASVKRPSPVSVADCLVL